MSTRHALIKLLLTAIASLLISGAVGTSQAQPFAYITNNSSFNVSVIDTATNAVVTTIGVGSGPTGVAVNLAGTRAYVVNTGSNNVSVIDTASSTVVATVAVGSLPNGVAVNLAGTRVYVTNRLNDNVSIIDTATNTVVATVAVGTIPFGVAVNPAGTRVYVANQNSGDVSVIDTAGNNVIATLAVGNGPLGIAVSPGGARAYVANFGSNTVSVIDTATNTVVATVTVGSEPYGVAVNPAGTRAYVSNYFGNSVSVIDTATNTVLATVAVGTNPYGIAVNPAGTRAYVANINSNNVSVIDTASNTVVAKVVVQTRPNAFGLFIGTPPSATVPGAPTIGPATAGVGSASVSFTLPASNGGSPITGYLVTANPGGITATGAGSPITVTGLTAGTPYTFTVNAINAIGTGPASAASNSVTPTSATVTVTPSAGANGTITPSTPQSIAQGSTTTFTVTPAAGFAATVGGTCGGSLAGTTYTTAVVTAPCTVSASFVALVTFNIVLEGAQEVPANAATGSGTGTVIVNTVDNLLTYNFSIANLSGALTGAHFHGPAARGSGAGIKLDIGAAPTSGTVVYSEVDEAAILAGLWYVDFHTGAYSGGELRGQLDNQGTARRVLDIVKAGTGSGRVSSSPAGIDCGSVCSFGFTSNTLVTLTAAPDNGSVFAGWSGGGCSGSAACQVTLNAAATVTATFVPLSLLDVVSRKTHGTAGTFSVPVDTTQAITGAVTIEPRVIGAGHQIVFRFSDAVSVPGSVSALDGAAQLVAATASASGNEVIVTLPGVPDKSRVFITLTGVNGNAGGMAAVGFLVGDVNNTRSVNSSDISGVKARSGQVTTGANFRFDVNASGVINASDVSSVKARSGTTLP